MEELERTQNQLVQSAKLAAVGELAAGVAHEVNNPLTSIIGFTTLILDDMHDADPLRADLEVIEREAMRCKSIVRGLLDFSRQTEPQIVPTDVCEVLQSTAALVRHQATMAGVTIRETYDTPLPPVPLDPDQIKQVFLNLMTNGIQAMPGGGELRIVTCLLGPQAGQVGEGHVAVEFHDTGVGIPQENLYRIFDPFFTTKETEEGTGLGLSISQSIVEKHGGRIKVTSQEGKGSVFSVLLPLAKGQTEGALVE
jgi:two-component system NtrC family sensor kinase